MYILPACVMSGGICCLCICFWTTVLLMCLNPAEFADICWSHAQNTVDIFVMYYSRGGFCSSSYGDVSKLCFKCICSNLQHCHHCGVWSAHTCLSCAGFYYNINHHRFKTTQHINDVLAAQAVVSLVSSDMLKCRSLNWLYTIYDYMCTRMYI